MRIVVGGIHLAKCSTDPLQPRLASMVTIASNLHSVLPSLRSNKILQCSVYRFYFSVFLKSLEVSLMLNHVYVVCNRLPAANAPDALQPKSCCTNPGL